MSKILEYVGDIAMVFCLVREILGYHFSVIHRPALMMIDIDSLTRRFGNLTAQYIQVTTLLSYYNKKAARSILRKSSDS